MGVTCAPRSVGNVSLLGFQVELRRARRPFNPERQLMRTKYPTHRPSTRTLNEADTMRYFCRGFAVCRIRPKEAAFPGRELWLSPIPYQKTVRDAMSQIASAQALQEDLPAQLEALLAALLDLAFTGNP